MEVYYITEDDLEQVPESSFDYEKRLEEQLVRSHGAEIAGERFLYVSQQQYPSGDQTTFDLVAADADGNTVIMELKRGRSPREIVAQALDYASGLRETEYDQLAEWYRDFRQRHGIETPADNELSSAHAEYFELNEPLSKREFNQEQRLLLLADEFNDKTLSVADFLREHDIDVICVVHQTFESEDGPHILTTEAVRRPIHMEPTGVETSVGPGEPTTESGKNRLEYWQLLNELIGEEPGTVLNNGWTPENYTWQNLAFPLTQVPLQAACMTRDSVVEMRLIIRDDRALFESLYEDRSAVQEAIEARFDGELGSDYKWEWISPDESDASKERGKIVWRRPIDLAGEQSREECANWTVSAAKSFYNVFTSEFDLKKLT